ncbi:hypothetical protein SASPL_135454 [Salvia splendens]|uniref:peptidylprolyl isomerase n=1 Tax=Salvia splendens TaxID=180675 RepID=A0A8X8WYS3_SALSN|nr:hypothetical protein SASPL_135454 [Salvia splendens]
MHTFFDGYVNSRSTLKLFAEQYEIGIHNKLQKEMHADYKSKCLMLKPVTTFQWEKQLLGEYTHNIGLWLGLGYPNFTEGSEFSESMQNRLLQVPSSVMIIWAYAFFLTAGGAYNYKGCSVDVPSSNILIDACRKHAYTMKHCRTDVSDAMRTAAWVRIPYPLQWGIPIFRLRTSLIMIFVSVVASVESVSSFLFSFIIYRILIVTQVLALKKLSDGSQDEAHEMLRDNRVLTRSALQVLPRNRMIGGQRLLDKDGVGQVSLKVLDIAMVISSMGVSRTEPLQMTSPPTASMVPAVLPLPGCQQLNQIAAMLEHLLARVVRFEARLDEHERRLSLRPEPDPPDWQQPYRPYNWSAHADPPNGLPQNYVQPVPDQQVPTDDLVLAYDPELYRHQFNPYPAPPPPSAAIFLPCSSNRIHTLSIIPAAAAPSQVHECDGVDIHYKGKLIDGTIFDPTFERGDPIDIKHGSGQVIKRRLLVLGMCLGTIRLNSTVGMKVGAILASIPQALAAAVLCFMWALVVALGLSTLQYTQTASFRNITIVGVSLFLGLSIPAYIQQYLLESSLILPSYLIPYSAASDGPVHTGNKGLDFAMNGLLSLNMVVTLLIAFVLDNTVPGSRQERGVYIWSNAEDLATDPSALSDYELPGKVCRWAKCLGVQ